MAQTTVQMRQIVDWSAAVWAGLFSGLLFLMTEAVLRILFGQGSGLLVRMIAAIPLGSQVVLERPTPLTYLAALVIHIPLSILFACLVATVIHRWGLLVGVIGGGLLGLALYGINFYAAPAIFPWFAALRSEVMLISHVIFGALAGGIYELLEVEEFVPQ